MIMKRPAADEIPIHDARLVHVNAAANLEVELALSDGRHPTAFYATRPRGDFHAVAHARDRLIKKKKPLRYPNQVRVVTNILGRATAAEKYPAIFLQRRWLPLDMALLPTDGCDSRF